MMKMRQANLDYQRLLLEKRQRKKHLEPFMIQPNPDWQPNPYTRLCPAKPRAKKEQITLVKHPNSNVISHDIDSPAAVLKPDGVSDPSVSSPVLEEDTENTMASKPGLRESLQKHEVTESIQNHRCIQVQNDK
ncbi:tubby-related protein 3-like isoform X2 [Saimiri boliviensis]|uniref:tubby-related protein 3-like isoform X2 n=1 Tax=Saimiri boliviensis TaxID=27679 RepID=UPI003D77A849